MNLKNIILSEICQPQKDEYHVIPLYETFRVVQIIETESRRLVAGAEGRGNGELLFNRSRISVLQDEKSYGDGWC